MNRLFATFAVLSMCQGCNTAIPPETKPNVRLDLQVVHTFKYRSEHLTTRIAARYQLGHNGVLIEESRPLSIGDFYNLLDQALKHHSDVLIVIETTFVQDLSISDLSQARDFIESHVNMKGFPVTLVHVFVELRSPRTAENSEKN